MSEAFVPLGEASYRIQDWALVQRVAPQRLRRSDDVQRLHEDAVVGSLRARREAAREQRFRVHEVGEAHVEGRKRDDAKRTSARAIGDCPSAIGPSLYAIADSPRALADSDGPRADVP